jgi:hypothetical protein
VNPPIARPDAPAVQAARQLPMSAVDRHRASCEAPPNPRTDWASAAWAGRGQATSSVRGADAAHPTMRNPDDTEDTFAKIDKTSDRRSRGSALHLLCTRTKTRRANRPGPRYSNLSDVAHQTHDTRPLRNGGAAFPKRGIRAMPARKHALMTVIEFDRRAQLQRGKGERLQAARKRRK